MESDNTNEQQRKRRPVKSLSVVQGGFSATAKRPAPPVDLTERQAAIWREIVSTENPDFFSTKATRDMLKDLVCHRDTINFLTQKINGFTANPDWLSQSGGSASYERFIKLRAIESRAHSLIATRLRLTNQSRYTPNHAFATGKNTAKTRPWEDPDPES